jgi:hypothetical protein
MRVAIIGLLPAQARIIQDEFPDLDLRISHQDARVSASLAAIAANGADKAIIMTRFVAHKQIGLIKDPIYVNGAMSSLRKVLRTMQPPCQKASLIEQAATMVHIPHEPNDFKKLRDAKVGDVLEFHRPPHHDIKTWSKTLARMTTFYRNKYGITTELSQKDGKAEIMIVSVDKGTPEKSPSVMPKAQPATPPVANDLDRRFWQEVFLQAQRNNPGSDAITHARQADAAIDALHAKFKEK